MVSLIWKGKSDISKDLDNSKNLYYKRYEILDFSDKDFNISAEINNDNSYWKNKLFWGDNLEILVYLLEDWEEKIKLIYIDPPFFSGNNYQIEIKDKEEIYEDTIYSDYWQNGLDSYLQMLYDRLILMKKLLSPDGLIFIHLDWHAAHYVKILLDEVFGQNRFVNDVIWYYYNKYSAGKKNLPRAHDNILVYGKSSNYILNEIRIPRQTPIKQLKREMINGVLKNVKDENGHVVYRIVKDKKLDDVWRIPCLQPASKEWTGFPTQKHHDLIEKIIKLGSNEQDLIADFFCGSGTTLLAAERLKRRWIGSDISSYSIYLSRKRLLESKENDKSKKFPFQILTELTEEKKKLIESGFFQKELEIKMIR
ncbi:MAG: DNA methyltransferase [Candidatus Heimdallarchaeota archaeon]